MATLYSKSLLEKSLTLTSITRLVGRYLRGEVYSDVLFERQGSAGQGGMRATVVLIFTPETCAGARLQFSMSQRSSFMPQHVGDVENGKVMLGRLVNSTTGCSFLALDLFQQSDALRVLCRFRRDPREGLYACLKASKIVSGLFTAASRGKDLSCGK